MKRIDNDIRNGQFKKAYLLFGEEDYLKKQYKEKLQKAVLPEGDTMNLASYEGKDVPIGEIIDLAETMPFFAERRLIILENTGLFKEAATDLADYIKDAPESVCFLFVEREVDKRGRMYKNTDKYGLAVEFKTPDVKILASWIGKKLGDNGLKIRESTVRLFLDRCGTDMNILNAELEKLSAYCMGRGVVEDADIEAICSIQISNEIFAMLEDMSEGRRAEAIRKYYDLLSLKEAPMRILFLISRQFRILMNLKDMDGKYPDGVIAKSCGVPPFALKKYRKGAARFERKRLEEAIRECADLEYSVKSGNLNDQMSVELLLAKYSGSMK